MDELKLYENIPHAQILYIYVIQKEKPSWYNSKAFPITSYILNLYLFILTPYFVMSIECLETPCFQISNSILYAILCVRFLILYPYFSTHSQLSPHIF